MRCFWAAVGLMVVLGSPAQAQVFGELRGGLYANGLEQGGQLFSPTRLQDANLEFVFKPLVDGYIFGSLHPAIGVTANFGDHKSYGYAGLNWHLPIMMTPIFVEAGLGAALSSNVLSGDMSNNHDVGAGIASAQHLGCSVLGHGEGSVGIDFAGFADVMLTVEHYFPATTCGGEASVTNVGARLGVSF